MRLFALLAALALCLATPACKTPNPPPPTDVTDVGTVDDGGAPTASAPVDCVSGVTEHAIADAQQRAINVIAEGVTHGVNQSVIIRNLEGLAVDIGPSALACALQYIGVKLAYDSDHASGQVATEKASESKVARAYLRSHGVTFAGPPPTPPVN